MPPRIDAPTPPPDPEAALFARLVERCLNWPCPTCGKRGLCNCYADLPPSVSEGDSTTEANHER